jgi:hypothetical protein
MLPWQRQTLNGHLLLTPVTMVTLYLRLRHITMAIPGDSDVVPNNAEYKNVNKQIWLLNQKS